MPNLFEFVSALLEVRNPPPDLRLSLPECALYISELPTLSLFK